MKDNNTAKLCRMTEDEARTFLEGIRWPNGPVCVHCGSVNVNRLQGKSTRPGLFKCRDCRKQFSVSVGTIFEASHIPLSAWVYAFARMNASKKGVSAHQLHREIGITYKSAWHMCHRIRHAMHQEPLSGLLKGTVEVDETYVGGKPRPGTGYHKRGRGTSKQPVLALVERDGSVRTLVVCDVTANTLKSAIRQEVCPTSKIVTDDNVSYRGIGSEFDGGHSAVKHSAGEYARSDGTNTNTVESFFALIKRGVYGTFHHVSKKHLHRYCNEFGFRWNHREINDLDRTVSALRGAEGKRLMYRQPVGLSA